MNNWFIKSLVAGLQMVCGLELVKKSGLQLLFVSGF